MPRTKNADSSTEARKRVTLQDIADVVGVRKMVVSNALNGTRSVAPATRERVLQVAREMNYVPNFAARALTTGRTGIIAILSGPLNQSYYANMVHQLECHVTDNGFHVMLMRTPNEVKELVNATGNIAVDGAIAVDMWGLVSAVRSYSAIPCVSISAIERDYVDNVIIDLSSGVEAALNLMLKAGRQRVAYLVTAATMAREAEVRARTYWATMKQANRTPELIDVSTENVAEVERNFKAYIEANGCPDALLCQNDETAMSIFRVLRASGYAIPRDVLLVGCDGNPHMMDFTPPLSTIVQPMEEMCAMAWKFLQQRIAQPELPQQVATFHGQLVVRESLLPSQANA